MQNKVVANIVSFALDIITGLSAVIAGHFLAQANLSKGIMITLYVLILVFLLAVSVPRMVIYNKRKSFVENNVKMIDRTPFLLTGVMLIVTIVTIMSRLVDVLE